MQWTPLAAFSEQSSDRAMFRFPIGPRIFWVFVVHLGPITSSGCRPFVGLAPARNLYHIIY
jgi:hypothetical protein